jgi:xanthine dehydrogenase iron-sulfur cluster and FAD-binding subunit A
MGLVAITLGATLVYRDRTSTVECATDEFFTGAMSTALPPAALLTCARFPVWPHRRVGVGFYEIGARKSDFAFASAAAQIALDEAGICERATLGIGAVCGVPFRLDRLGAALVGRSRDQVSENLIRDEVESALADKEVFSDLHASAAYRRRAAAALLTRAIMDAFRDAQAWRQSTDSKRVAPGSQLFVPPGKSLASLVRDTNDLVSRPSEVRASSPERNESRDPGATASSYIAPRGVHASTHLLP